MKAPARTVALIARSERRLTERTGIASFQVRVITYAGPERPRAARPAG